MTLAGCHTSKNVIYLQDVQVGEKQPITNASPITIQPKDMLSIVVSSADPQISKIFNLPLSAVQAGTDRAASNGYVIGYVVDNDGCIDFPVLGKLHVKGMTRVQLQEYISRELNDRQQLKDGNVTIEFMNFRVSVLGEVTEPGTYTFTGDRVTVLDAIAAAKDLTICGMRDRVFVIREEGGKRMSYQLDLRSADIFNSPAYYVKQNDVIYVQPNSVKAGQSTINQNSMRTVSLWVSIASLLTSIGVLVAQIVKD